MNKTLLINRLNTKDHSDKKHKIFFMIGKMDVPEVENRLIDVLHSCDMIEPSDLVLKYNGIELYISVQQIPQFVKLLSEENFLIYEIFHPYNPEG